MLKYTQFRYCPKCGQDSLVQLDIKSFKCTICNMKYYHNTASAVGAIIITPRGVVLARRAEEPSMGLLDIPGGFTDYNESLEEALRREIREELSIEITTLRYMASFPNTYKYAKITYFTTDVFFITYWNDIDAIKPNKEIIHIEFIDPKHIDPDKLAFESNRLVFRELANMSLDL